MTQAMPQPLTQLADVALDDVLVDFLAEQSVDVVENLCLGHATSPIVHEVLQDPPLASGQRQDLTLDQGIAAIGENLQLTQDCAFILEGGPAADGANAGENFAHVNRFANDIVDAGCKQFQRLIQRFIVVHGDDGSARTALDQLGERVAVAAIAQKKCFNG
jgi:hypothetical protein